VFCVWRNIERGLCPEIERYTELDVQAVAVKYYTKGGTPLKEPLPEITFEVASLDGLRSRDSLWAGLPYLVFSRRLRAALTSMGVTNIEYYPAVIKNAQTGESILDYMIANIVGLVACLDWQRSRYEVNPKSAGHLKKIEHLAINEAAIPAELLLFRLSEMRTVILCRDRLADGLTQLGITGVRFVPMDEFSTGW
jgi:hypothetical protein